MNATLETNTMPDSIKNPDILQEKPPLPEKEVILIIEDEAALAEGLAYNLRREGFEVVHATDGRKGLAVATTITPQFVLLDLMLPGMSGTEVLRELRNNEKTKRTPVIILSAKGEETDQVVGFSLGADDYVTKPFSVKVLLERIKALQRRRAGVLEESDTVCCHGIAIDRHRHRAEVVDREDRLEELDAVVGEQRDDIAACHACGSERAGKLPRPLRHLAIGDGAAFEHHDRVIGRRLGSVPEDPTPVQIRLHPRPPLRACTNRSTLSTSQFSFDPPMSGSTLTRRVLDVHVRPTVRRRAGLTVRTELAVPDLASEGRVAATEPVADDLAEQHRGPHVRIVGQALAHVLEVQGRLVSFTSASALASSWASTSSSSATCRPAATTWSACLWSKECRLESSHPERVVASVRSSVRTAFRAAVACGWRRWVTPIPARVAT